MKFDMYVEVDEWCMTVCRLQYDLIQGQGQGREPLKVGNSAILKDYLLPHL